MNTMLNALKRPKKLSCKEMLSNQGMKTKRLAKIKKKKKGKTMKIWKCAALNLLHMCLL